MVISCVMGKEDLPENVVFEFLPKEWKRPDNIKQ